MTAVNLTLHPSQMRVFQSKSRFRVIVAGRRWGKSQLSAISAISAGLDPKNVQKKAVYIVGPTFAQTKAIYWTSLLDLGREVIESVRVNEGEITLVNGVKIYLRGSDREDTLRGLGIWFLVLDEAQDVKPEVWSVILRPTLADVRGNALIIFTPKGQTNWTYSLWETAQQDPEWACFHFKTTDNPYLDAAEIESARNSMSSQAFAQEFEASFVSGSTDLFHSEWFKYGATKPTSGAYFIAVDLAGFGGENTMVRNNRLDQTAIAVVFVHADGWFVEDIQLGRWGVKETASRIVSAHKKYNPQALGIERGALRNAVLPYLSEEMQRQRCWFEAQNLSHNNRGKTDRIVWALAGRFEHGRIKLRPAPWNATLTDELLNLGAKGVHDDAADALAYIAQLADHAIFAESDFDFSFNDDNDAYEPLSARSGY